MGEVALIGWGYAFLLAHIALVNAIVPPGYGNCWTIEGIGRFASAGLPLVVGGTMIPAHLSTRIPRLIQLVLGSGLGVAALCSINSSLSGFMQAGASALATGLIVGAVGGIRSTGRRFLVAGLVAVLGHQLLSLLTGGIHSPSVGISRGVISIAALGMIAAPPLALVISDQQSGVCKTNKV